MLTSAGRQLVLDSLLPSLAGAIVTVFDKEGNSQSKPLDQGFPTIDGSSVILQATYQSNEANFDWHGWSVAAGDHVIDEGRSEQGRKVEGSVWTFAVALDFLPDEG